MNHLNEIIVVEGKHDIDAVKRVVDATVLDTGGFGIFTDKMLGKTLRELAQKRGVIVLTDSDAAGFAIRRRLNDVIGPANVKNVYVPDIYGKERRKTHPSKEGKIGVEGMSDEVLLKAFEDAGVFMAQSENRSFLTKAIFYEDGLSGRPNSREKCVKIKQKLNLPEHLNTSKLIEVLNVLLTVEEYEKLIEDINGETENV